MNEGESESVKHFKMRLTSRNHTIQLHIHEDTCNSSSSKNLVWDGADGCHLWCWGVSILLLQSTLTHLRWIWGLKQKRGSTNHLLISGC